MSCTKWDVTLYIFFPAVIYIAAATLSSALGSLLAQVAGSANLTVANAVAMTAVGSLPMSLLSFTFGPGFGILAREILLPDTGPCYSVFLAFYGIFGFVLLVEGANAFGILALFFNEVIAKDQDGASILWTGPVGGVIVGVLAYVSLLIYPAGCDWWRRRKQEREEEDIELQRIEMEVDRLWRSIVHKPRLPSA